MLLNEYAHSNMIQIADDIINIQLSVVYNDIKVFIFSHYLGEIPRKELHYWNSDSG